MPARKRAGVAERLERQRRRDDTYLESLRATMQRRGCELGQAGPVLIPPRLWAMARECLADPSGRALRIYLGRARNRPYVGALRNGALAPDAEGLCRYSWHSERARRIAVLGLLELGMAKRTRRKGRWGLCCQGVTRGALCAALADPYSRKRPSVSALAGTHRAGATLQSGQIGYLRALEASGALYSQQLPASQVEAFERCWPSGYACNRYWLLRGDPDGHLTPATLARLLELAHAGHDAPTERVRVRRRDLQLESPADPAPS